MCSVNLELKESLSLFLDIFFLPRYLDDVVYSTRSLARSLSCSSFYSLGSLAALYTIYIYTYLESRSCPPSLPLPLHSCSRGSFCFCRDSRRMMRPRALYISFRQSLQRAAHIRIYSCVYVCVYIIRGRSGQIVGRPN